MAMPKRLSGSRRVVAFCDPALETFPRLKTKMVEGREVPELGLAPYGSTLDISYLGDLEKLDATVFEIMPLQSRFMSWDRGADTDFYAVFQAHVIKIENYAAKPPLTFEKVGNFDYKILTEESMDQIPMGFIKDIGNMILQLAKYDGVTIPFTMLDSSTDVLKRCRIARSLKISPVRMVDVKTSESPGEPSTS